MLIAYISVSPWLDKREGNIFITGTTGLMEPFIIQDIVEPIKNVNQYDYIIHCTSNADSKSYASDPVEEYGISVVIARFPSVYGPTMKK